MANPVVHFEFLSKEPAKLASFYEEVFGWKVQHRPELNYRIVETGGGEGGMGGINGGIIKPDRPEPWPDNTTLYVNVDDLAVFRKRVVNAGGKILVEDQEVPGMGRFVLFADPEGRMMGLWKAAAKMAAGH